MPEIVKRAPDVADDLARLYFQKDSQLLAAIYQSNPNLSVRPEAIARAAISTIRASDTLKRCTKYSLICSIVESAQLGLSLDKSLGQAYLVPFQGVATLMLGYRGLCELARRSGLIGDIVGELRYEKDFFSMKLGSNRSIEHIPFDGPSSKRGKVIGVYAVAEFVNGWKPMFEYMDLESVDAIKSAVLKRKKSDKLSPWETNESEMQRKTPIRRLAKRMPQSPVLIPFVGAAIRDEYREAGIRVSNVMESTPELEAVDMQLEAEGLKQREPGDERESVIKEKKPVKGDTITYETACDMRSQCEEIGVKVDDVLRSMRHSGTLETLPVGRQVDFNKALSTHAGK